MRRLGVLFSVALLASCVLGVGRAAYLPLAGSLDLGFGNDGVVTHELSSNEYGGIVKIALQPDGRIVTAAAASPGDRGVLLARYLADGSPDPSFGQDGYVETDPSPPATYAFAEAIALQADGKIIVAGLSDPSQSDNVYSDFMLARYNQDGSLDTSFGTDGITNTVIPEQQPSGACFFSQAGAGAVAVLPNGDILAGGTSEWGDSCGNTRNSSFVLARYTPDGSLDPSFGTGGIVQTTFSGLDSLAGVAVQPDGKIVAAGTSAGPGRQENWQSIALARYEPDGSLDPTFGTGGKVTTAHKLGLFGGPLTLQHGKIVVAGTTRVDGGAFFPVLVRYQTTGRLDQSFGKRGLSEFRRITGNFYAQGGPTDVVVQRHNDKLLISAANSVVRLTPNGAIDKSFGRGGIEPLTGRAGAFTLAVEPDNKILVGGNTGNTATHSGTTWLLAELLAGDNCVVPQLRGDTVSHAAVALKQSYCERGHVAQRFSSMVARGRVISTTPPTGTRQLDGTRVNLIVSKGRRR